MFVCLPDHAKSVIVYRCFCQRKLAFCGGLGRPLQICKTKKKRFLPPLPHLPPPPPPGPHGGGGGGPRQCGAGAPLPPSPFGT